MLDRRHFFLGAAALAIADAAVGGAGANESVAPGRAGPEAAKAAPEARNAEGKLAPGANAALIVVDLQNCFLPGGSLAVKDGDKVVPVVNRLAKAFANIVVTQDWHTPGHISFASSHPDKKPFDRIELPYGEQVLWPDHCVQGTDGAQFARDLELPRAQLVLRKGFHPRIDSYSAFTEADRKTRTGLEGYLKERGIDTLFVVGLATDFCVAWTAIDGAQAGFRVYVVEDATRGVDLDGSLQRSWEAMRAAGVGRIQSSDVEA